MYQWKKYIDHPGVMHGLTGEECLLLGDLGGEFMDQPGKSVYYPGISWGNSMTKGGVYRLPGLNLVLLWMIFID